MHRILRPGLCRNIATNATLGRIAGEFNGLAIPSSHDNSSVHARSTIARRHDPTIEQRRAARLAREATVTARGGFDGSPRTRWQNSEAGAGIQRRSRPAATRARAANQDWLGDLDALGQFKTKKSNPSPRDRRGRGSERTTAPFNGSQRTKSRARNRFSDSESGTAPSTTLSQSGNSLSKEDIPFNVIEEGGEEPSGAEIVAPESLSTDLAAVLGQTRSMPGLQQNLPAVVKKDRTKYIIETFGGDYTRYSPHTARDYLTTPTNINAVKMAQLALSKNKEIDLNQRQILLKIVSRSSISNKEVSRA